MTSHHLLDDDHERRFGGLDRLYGDGSRFLLHGGRIAVIGVGGVGSWAVEALARSGIGHLTLIDMDHVAVSNVNRQVQALESTLGQSKISALQHRIRDINPVCRVNVIDDFLSEENIARLVPAGTYDMVIDACDDARAKIALIVHAHRLGIPLIVCGAAGGKDNPLNLRVDDLARVTHDALLARMRTKLRKERLILPRKNGKFGVECVYLEEPSRRNTECTIGNLSCAGFGSVVTVTAAMGLVAASLCLKRITSIQNQGNSPTGSKGSLGVT